MNYRPFYGNKEIYLFFANNTLKLPHVNLNLTFFICAKGKKKTINKKSFQVINRFLKLTNQQSKR